MVGHNGIHCRIVVGCAVTVSWWSAIHPAAAGSVRGRLPGSRQSFELLEPARAKDDP
jgi:hypothetical protein